MDKDLLYYENIHNTKFPNKKIKVISIENKIIYYKTEFGICKQSISNFLRGSYKIYSAINKTEFLINYIKKKFGNKYDYSKVEYKPGSSATIILICKIHGEFVVNLQNYLKRGYDCFDCKKEIKLKEKHLEKSFIKKANKVHKNIYDYSMIDYKSSFVKIKIICKTHGEFLQSPHHHLEGVGCRKCANMIIQEKRSNDPTGWCLTRWEEAASNSKNFDSFKVYIIECWNDEERFYKIGRTYKSVKNRFTSKSGMPYKYKILKQYIDSAENIYNLEINLKKLNKTNKYLPTIKFNGMWECFSQININENERSI